MTSSSSTAASSLPLLHQSPASSLLLIHQSTVSSTTHLHSCRPPASSTPHLHSRRLLHFEPPHSRCPPPLRTSTTAALLYDRLVQQICRSFEKSTPILPGALCSTVRAIGALDGTLVHAIVPADQQTLYRGRGKDECFQNVRNL